jgi:hypothetical protein
VRIPRLDRLARSAASHNDPASLNESPLDILSWIKDADRDWGWGICGVSFLQGSQAGAVPAIVTRITAPRRITCFDVIAPSSSRRCISSLNWAADWRPFFTYSLGRHGLVISPSLACRFPPCAARAASRHLGPLKITSLDSSCTITTRRFTVTQVTGVLPSEALQWIGLA